MTLREEITRPRTKMERLLAGDLDCAPDGAPFTEEELRELQEILSDGTIGHSVIHRLIANHGYVISENTILRYRKDVLHVTV